jgi:hypothetical protein
MTEPPLSAEKVVQIRHLWKAGVQVKKIAELTGVHVATVRKHALAAGLPLPRQGQL